MWTGVYFTFNVYQTEYLTINCQKFWREKNHSCSHPPTHPFIYFIFCEYVDVGREWKEPIVIRWVNMTYQVLIYQTNKIYSNLISTSSVSYVYHTHSLFVYSMIFFDHLLTEKKFKYKISNGFLLCSRYKTNLHGIIFIYTLESCKMGALDGRWKVTKIYYIKE